LPLNDRNAVSAGAGAVDAERAARTLRPFNAPLVRTPLPILRPSSLGYWTAQQFAQSAMPHAIFTRDKFRCPLIAF